MRLTRSTASALDEILGKNSIYSTGFVLAVG